MSIKGKKVKFAELNTSLSILKATIDIEFNMNLYLVRKKWSASLAFTFLTRNSTWVYHQLLVFQTPSEMSIKGLRVRYADLMTLVSIFKGTVNMN